MGMEYADILKRLKEYRVSMNMTQEQLSSITGIGQSKMCKLEKGDLIISYEFLKILNDMHWNIDYLLVGKKEENTIHVLADYIKTIPEKRETKKLICWAMETYFRQRKIENVDCDLYLLRANLDNNNQQTVLFNLRNYLKLNQSVMAEKLGIRFKKYCSLEKERKEPDAEFLLRIYLLTGCRPGIFFEDNREDFLVNVLCQKIPKEKQKEMIEFVEASNKLFD